MTWSQLLRAMNDRYQNALGHERKGQAYFNALFLIEPEIANMIRGTDADPFHDDSCVSKFLMTIRPYFI